MLLALDIGNTNIKFGVYTDGGDGESYTPDASWRINTERGRTADEYGFMITNLLPTRGINPWDVTAVAFCSAVPPLRTAFVEVSKAYFKQDPLVVGAGTKTGIKVLYDNPRDVGADRIVDAVAALELYGGPAIVVDFGTGTVFDAVTAGREYLGGAIAPGLSVAADSLYQAAAQLRRVELKRPETAIGRNTIHALQSGLVLGYADMVKGMVRRFDEELGGGSKVIATGGLARLIADETGIFDAVNDNLTLAGLKIIHELNS
jgi:type III pantothenate kinase